MRTFVSVVACGVSFTLAAPPTISVNQTSIAAGGYVSVNLDSVPQAERSGCWIGLFDATAKIQAPYNMTTYYDHDMPKTNPAPAKFILCSKIAGFMASGVGSVDVRLLDMRADLQLGLFFGGKTVPKAVDNTGTIQVTGRGGPQHLHIARTQDNTEMLVQWSSAFADGQELRWRTSATGAYTHTAPAVTQTYLPEDTCGAPANKEGWWSPGWLHRALVTGLTPGVSQVEYQVGSQKNGWSKQAGFAAAQPVGATQSVNLLITADVGCLEPDGFHSHWSGPDTQEQQSNLTWSHLNTAPQADILMHYGDLSYATGYLAKWELYMQQIEDVASRTPYMTGLGNHERDWPNSGSAIGKKDSGGECGVPTERRFWMPSPGGKQDDGWYSVDQGSVHLVHLNTEMPCGKGSSQYAWLEADLASVNRSVTPWVILGGHRPLYRVERHDSIGPDVDDTRFILGAVDMEPLLMKHQVDLALWGHVHNALVTCPVFNGTCVPPKADGSFDAPVHAVVGNGGQVLSGVPPPKERAAWVKYQANEWGWAQIFVHNASHMHMMLLDDVANDVHYDFWIVRNRSSASAGAKANEAAAATDPRKDLRDTNRERWYMRYGL